MKILIKAVVTATAFAASACAGVPTMPGVPGPITSSGGVGDSPVAEAAVVPAPVIPGLAPKDTVSRAAELLAAGKDVEARTVLQAVLAGSPRDATAQNFLRQIDTDPLKLLGEPSADAYVVQTGDTMSGLADRFLGDSRMFYALSRYNGLAAPNALAVGRVLKLPASAKRQPPASSAAASSAAAKADATKGNDMRLQALQMLNKGEVEGAIAILKQAAALDANDPAIRKDLERAERIQGALSKG